MVKISVNIICWNEATVIDLALKSIKDFADEVIIVDNGSNDGTVDVVRKYVKKYGLDAKIFVKKGFRVRDSRWYAIKKSTGDWICIVDGDHVLNTGYNEPNIHTLRELAEKDDELAYNYLYFHMYGDFMHLDKSRVISDYHPMLFKNIPKKIIGPYGGEGKKYRWGLRYNNPEFDYPEVNKTGIIGVNLAGMKPPVRMYSREWFSRFYKDLNRKFDNPMEYARYSRGKKLEEEANKWFLNKLKNNNIKIEEGMKIKRKCLFVVPELVQGVRFKDLKSTKDVRKFREVKVTFDGGIKRLPDTIQVELENPRYEIIYEDDDIVGRKPDLV